MAMLCIVSVEMYEDKVLVTFRCPASASGAPLGARGDPQSSRAGKTLASPSSDKSTQLWRTYGENSNYGVLEGQNGAITSIAFPSSAPHLMAGSTDKTVATFDTTTGEIVRKFIEGLSR